MLDLRGNWAFDYTDRVLDLQACLEVLCTNFPDQDKSELEEYLEIIDTAKGELTDITYDGRVFRDFNLYGYKSKLGITERVLNDLELSMTYPENYLPSLPN
jgi:hypothetical protein